MAHICLSVMMLELKEDNLAVHRSEIQYHQLFIAVKCL